MLRRVGLIVLAAIGCFICVVLADLGAPGEGSTTIFGKAVCAPSQSVDCDYVLSSRWAKLGPVPVAVLGAAYFLAVGVWFAAIGLPNYNGRRWHLLPLGVVLAGLGGSAFFSYLMVFRLPVWCSWCAAAHVVNALIFLLSVLSWPRRSRTDARAVASGPPHPSNTRALAVVASCLVLILLVVVGMFARRAQLVAWQYQRRYLAVTNDVDYLEWRYRKAPVQEIAVRPDDLVLGPRGAPNTIVVFTDFECSRCQAFFLSAASLVERFPEKLGCVFKHYPIAAACNPDAPRGFHHFSCEAALAALAAEAVGDAGQALEYHRELYASRSRFDERPYVEIAVRVGMDSTLFAAAQSGGSGRERLEEDIVLARRLGVKETPAIFLNGRRLLNWKIVTADAEGKMDVDQTVALWERMVGETSKR
jgi:uncharacterized membrane protein/protein-disulfide isomerase